MKITQDVRRYADERPRLHRSHRGWPAREVRRVRRRRLAALPANTHSDDAL